MNARLSVVPRRSAGIRPAFVLPLVMVALVILCSLAIGTLMTSYYSRIDAVKVKAQTEAMLAAEAGYEEAIFWMSQQTDILGALQNGDGDRPILNFGVSGCTAEVSFREFLGARPVFQVTSVGRSGRPAFTRVVDVSVIQETAGWAMGACRVPTGSSSSSGVYFKTGEIVDMPLHINKANDSPDNADIFISGTPSFRRRVEMGEARKTSGGSDKNILDTSGNVIGSYTSAMPLFLAGIYFEQPGIRIADEAAVTSKVNRFLNSTSPAFRYTPQAHAGFSTTANSYAEFCRRDAVQLEFFVDAANIGRVRITNHCSIRGYRRKIDDRTYDYSVVPGSGGNSFQRYHIYAYHYAPDPADPNYTPRTYAITETYVTQNFGGYTSEPGGQIYVDGDVIIGGSDPNLDPNMIVKGKLTVVASGNIWLGDNIIMDGIHDVNGPVADNPNVLGLIAQGVIKVVDPGMSEYNSGTSNGYPGDATFAPVSDINAASTLKHYYKPIGNLDPAAAEPSNRRKLPDPTVIEAALTIGGGGFGAENVQRGSAPYGGRKEFSGAYDDLVVRGSITEVVRGVVGVFQSSTSTTIDGYEKNYYIDNRLMTGILPADIWFTGKYIPSPAGWHDHAVGND